jgi:glucose-1-phosphate adenylyltransferase
MQIDIKTRHISRLARNTLALILAGGRGARLQDLTQWRAKPAVHFGGKFRIIDFPLSNCVNSGIRRIGVLTQYKAHSLIRHLVRGWGRFQNELGEFVEVLPASQRTTGNWYAGTADAVYQNLDIIRTHRPELVLILAGDHVYKMDYGAMLAFHAEQKADMTVGCVEVSLEEARGFGVMAVDDQGKVERFDEKPKHPIPMPGSADTALASMGIYVFNTEFLCDELIRDARDRESERDFGRNIIPDAIARSRVFAYPFRDPETGEQGFWRDVGTVDAYWSANMELVDQHPELDLYDSKWPILTYQPQLPSAKFLAEEGHPQGTVIDSIVSGGCIVRSGQLNRSVLFSSVKVDAGSQIEECVVFPGVTVGRDCRIRKAIIDVGCEIPDGAVIGEDPEDDAQRFHVSQGGVVLITPEMLGQRPPQFG